MQLVLSVVLGIAGLYMVIVGAYHLALGAWFPYLPEQAGMLFRHLQATVGGGAFTVMAVGLLIVGGLLSFLALLLFPTQKR